LKIENDMKGGILKEEPTLKTLFL